MLVTICVLNSSACILSRLYKQFKNNSTVRFLALTAASMKMKAFRDIAPCSHVEVDRRFRGAYSLHHQFALMMETVGISETSVSFYETTRRNIPEGRQLQ
jgi:hypothetical protein